MGKTTAPRNWYAETQFVVTHLQLKSIQSCIKMRDLLQNSKKQNVLYVT